MTNFLLDDADPNPLFPARSIGVLGTLPSNKEVIGVYPTLSSTLIPYQQDLRFFRGDSFDIAVQIQDDQDPPSNVSISRAVMRFAAKLGVGNLPSRNDLTIRNEGATIVKKSYLMREIEYTDEANGRALIHIKRADTREHPMGAYFVWDLELTVPTMHLEGQPGTVTVSAGDAVILGNGTDFLAAEIEPGDIIHAQERHILIEDVIDARALRVDFTGWTSEVRIPYNLYRGSTRTVAAGQWLCIGDVVI